MTDRCSAAGGILNRCAGGGEILDRWVRDNSKAILVSGYSYQITIFPGRN